MSDYSDIIKNQKRPELPDNHPPMSLSNRAKIFAPFAALRGHSERLGEEVKKIMRVHKIELSEDEASVLSDKLAKIKKGMDITMMHFLPDAPDSSMGYYVRTSGKIVEMDAIFQKLKIADEDNNAISTVRFDDVVDVTLWGNLHIYEK